MDGKVHGRWHGPSPYDNERTITLWTKAFRFYERGSRRSYTNGPSVAGRYRSHSRSVFYLCTMKFVELTADVLKIFFIKYRSYCMAGRIVCAEPVQYVQMQPRKNKCFFSVRRMEIIRRLPSGNIIYWACRSYRPGICLPSKANTMKGGLICPTCGMVPIT